MLGRLRFSLLLATTAFLALERPADACGGCFHGEPPSTPVPGKTESSVVADHRMVFSLGRNQTVLWDQIRYNGDPAEFAWVLPVRAGSRVELSHDEWIAALDVSSQPVVQQPATQSFGGGGASYGGNGGDGYGGCGCGDSTTASAFSEGANAGSPESTPAPPPDVQIVKQEVVGPYESVIVHSDKPHALEGWLHDHGYAIPDSIGPVIEAYQGEGFDFIALRLRPGQGVRAMKPVRVITPGADATLPLRMVAAGIGSHVGLTLYVLSEGRYRPQNFPEESLVESQITWDTATSRSNYQDLSIATMGHLGGRTWITEYAQKPRTIGGIPGQLGGIGSTTGTPATPALYDAYYTQCYGQFRTSYPPVDAGVDAADDAGDPDPDAGEPTDPDASPPDASMPADDGGASSTPTPGLCTSASELCCDYDDLELAMSGLHAPDVWLTRLRADLPVGALATDLLLQAHPSQTPVSNIHYATLPTTASGASISPKRSALGTTLAIGFATLLVGRMLRRRRR